MATNKVVIEAIETAARKIEECAAECGASHCAEQQRYGIMVEALVDREWVALDDVIGFPESIEAVRLYDCDGERGRACRTLAQVEAEAARWREALEMSAATEGGE